MDRDALWRDFEALAPEAQRRVMELIAALRAGTDARGEADEARGEPLAEEPFVGIWRNRDDMQDSTRWVRGVREREWAR